MCIDCGNNAMSRWLAQNGECTAGTAGLLGVGNAAAAAKTRTRPSDGQSFVELVMLGTQAGPAIEPGRTGLCTVLVVDGANYVVDCGRSATHTSQPAYG